MGKLYELKGYWTKYYAKYSRYIDKALQFVLALSVFLYINQHLEFSKLLANPIMAIVLSVICMLLPLPLTAILAMVVTFIQIVMVSTGMAIVAVALFLILYAFYFRYAQGKMVLLLLVPVAFMLKIPVVIPIVFGLLSGPIAILPLTGGAMVHYMIEYVQSNATLFQTVGDTELGKQILTYAQQFLMNPEMWCTIVALAVSFLLVYGVRRMSVDHSWELGIVVGILGNVNVMAYGFILMDIPITYTSLIIGSLVAILAGLVVKFFAFSVDYTRTEYLQFEDDEYYYHVKAVPKVSVATPKKTVKLIHERQKTGMIDTEQVRNMEFLEENQLTKQEIEESEIQRIIEEELKQEK